MLLLCECYYVHVAIMISGFMDMVLCSSVHVVVSSLTCPPFLILFLIFFISLIIRVEFTD